MLPMSSMFIIIISLKINNDILEKMRLSEPQQVT